MSAVVEQAAGVLRTALARRAPVPPLSGNLLAHADVETAYAVQAVNVSHAIASGRRRTGLKIGLTSAAIQRQLGIDEPDMGVLFADMEVEDGGVVDRSALIAPRVETEVAFLVGRDLAEGPFSFARVAASLDAAVTAVEIADSRIADWRIQVTDTVADNASAAMYVLGRDWRSVRQVELRVCGMEMSLNGVQASTGSGAACMGHPVAAVTWLASHMAARGQPLTAGDIVLSGALGPMTAVDAGSAVDAEISGLGRVRFSFA